MKALLMFSHFLVMSREVGPPTNMPKGDEQGDKDHTGDVPAANEGYHSWTRSIELSPRAVRNHSAEFRRTFIVFTALTARQDAGGSDEQATIFRAPGSLFQATTRTNA
jgi:hypothetical protein